MQIKAPPNIHLGDDDDSAVTWHVGEDTAVSLGGGGVTSESDGRTLTLHPESGLKNVLKQHKAEIPHKHIHTTGHTFKKNSYKI